MSYQSLVKFSDSVHAPLRTVQRKCPIPEIGRRKCAKSSTITQPSSSSSSSTNFIATQVLKQNFRAVRWSIAVKFSMSMMMRHRTAKVAELLKFSCNQNQSCSLHPILCEIWIPVSTPLAFESWPAFRNEARYMNCETNSASADDCHMSSTSLIKVRSSNPWEPSGESSHNNKNLKNKNVLNRQ